MENCTEYNILVQIFHQKKDQIRDEVRHIRLKENPNAAQQGDHQRLDRPILKITSRIDQSISWNTKKSRLNKMLQGEKSLVDGRIISAGWTNVSTDERTDEKALLWNRAILKHLS